MVLRSVRTDPLILKHSLNLRKMSQSGSNPPSVVVNAQGNRQQVPLRDYLNARVAPFLKKAITQSLDVEYVHLEWSWRMSIVLL